METTVQLPLRPQRQSRPSRARGLKPGHGSGTQIKETVAPLAGAWIETLTGLTATWPTAVAPLAGAWIETCRR